MATYVFGSWTDASGASRSGSLEHTTLGFASLGMRALCTVGSVHDQRALDSLDPTAVYDSYLARLDDGAQQAPGLAAPGDGTLSPLGVVSCRHEAQSAGTEGTRDLPLMAAHFLDADTRAALPSVSPGPDATDAQRDVARLLASTARCEDAHDAPYTSSGAAGACAPATALRVSGTGTGTGASAEGAAAEDALCGALKAARGDAPPARRPSARSPASCGSSRGSTTPQRSGRPHAIRGSARVQRRARCRARRRACMARPP